MNYKLSILICLLGLATFSACSDDDSPQPVTINFTNQEVGISSNDPSAEIGITFSRAAESSGTFIISVTSSTLTYGATADFYTDPEMDNEVLTIGYEAGDESVSFTVAAGEALNITADQTVVFNINDPGGLIIGDNTSVSVTFSENFIAPSGIVELDAGGADFTKQAFVDLSKLQQTTVDKYSWDLGFSSQAGAYYVTINSTTEHMARAIDKTDLNTVTAQDTLGFSNEMVTNGYAPEGGYLWIDSPDGNLEATAIGSISATETDNKVFIIKRNGEGENWKKIRILQNGDNYTLQYADIAATTFDTAEITKDADFNFSFFDLDNGETQVEPFKNSWDIMYGTYTEVINFGYFIPYGYKDYIVINRNETSVAMIMEADIAYANFSSSDAASLEFASEINTIGSSWRSGGGPTSGPALFEDRFYILKDAEGTIYKMKFTSLTSTEGERGYPEFKFERIN